MNRADRYILTAILATLLLLSLTSAAYADLEQVKRGCVSITSICGTGDNAVVSSGSGFLVSPDGFIVTNAHVIISNDIGVQVKIADRPHTVTGILYYLDDLLDIAVLKVQLAGLEYLEMGDDSELKLGQRLFAVGSPLVFTDIFTDGIYSSYNEELGMIQHTAELSHGNSGGPLVTEEGLVMGVNTIVFAIPGESRYYFAIPSHIVKAVVDGVRGQATLTEIDVDCAERLEEAPAPAPAPAEPSEPAPSEPTYYDIEVNPDYVTYVIDSYPQGWFSVPSLSFHYIVDFPDFYNYQLASDDEYLMTGLDFFCSYDNFDDPYFAAVPLVMLYIGFPEAESFHEFKQRMWSLFEADGFEMDREFTMEDVYTSQPSLEFDAYWFNGLDTSDYSNLSKSIYFVRDRDIKDAYYCLDFTFNNTVEMDAFNGVTIPLLLQILWTFGTEV